MWSLKEAGVDAVTDRGSTDVRARVDTHRLPVSRIGMV